MTITSSGGRTGWQKAILFKRRRRSTAIETKRRRESWGVSVRLEPVGGFQVPKNHNARFGPDWVTKFITFDGENSHGGGNDGAPNEG